MRDRCSGERHRAVSSRGRWWELTDGPWQGKARTVTHKEATALTLVTSFEVPPTLTLKGDPQCHHLRVLRTPDPNSLSHKSGTVLGSEFSVTQQFGELAVNKVFILLLNEKGKMMNL